MSTSSYRLVMAQLNPLVGDITGNRDKICASIEQARDDHQAQCVVFSELVLTGYPPEDLLLRSAFIEDCEQAINDITQTCRGITAIVGAPYSEDGRLYNAAYVIQDQQIIAVARKQVLPNYSVFDEQRYFVAGDAPCVTQLAPGITVGISVCEDIWHVAPARALVDAGAGLIININASPYLVGKQAQRLNILRSRISETGVPVIYVNQIGGQDELVFDGGSMALNSREETVVLTPAFKESNTKVDLEVRETGQLDVAGQIAAPTTDDVSMLYQALVIGVRDYAGKNGFSAAILGLSGGIDSALTLAIAVDALGAENISAVMMPSEYTADMSQEDAQLEAEHLGVAYHVVPIARARTAFDAMLSELFSDTEADVTEENIQARSRGLILMAISNKQGKLVLTTGNKSEMAVGYATLYGDMAGGFAPLKDVYKTMVYELARYRNTVSPVIPQRVIDRPPSAELAPDQTDQDSLPDYDMLDDILRRYIELDEPVESIVQAGYDKALVEKMLRRVDFNEYKRRQAPPGIKVTERAFGKDRRYPITSASKYS